MSSSHMEGLVRALLLELGEDPDREGLRRTPARVAALLERFSASKPRSVQVEPEPTQPGDGRMTVLRGLAYASLCEHHLLPFFGQLHIGCIERKRRCTASLCVEVIEQVTHRPQLQERITEEIADALFRALEPEGLGVAGEGRHLCMMMRGVQKQGSRIQSSTLRGCFFEPTFRRAFFAHMARGAPMVT